MKVRAFCKNSTACIICASSWHCRFTALPLHDTTSSWHCRFMALLLHGFAFSCTAASEHCFFTALYLYMTLPHNLQGGVRCLPSQSSHTSPLAPNQYSLTIQLELPHRWPNPPPVGMLSTCSQYMCAQTGNHKAWAPSQLSMALHLNDFN
eukprot:1156698-Pelagomonas_calceolata.AAC.5